MNTIQEITHRGYTIKLIQDECAEDPLSYRDGVLINIAHWHRRYDIGGERGERQAISSSDWKLLHAGPSFIVLPLRMIDHSGCDFSIGSTPYEGDSAGWDSGQIGFVWCSWVKARKLLGGKLSDLRKRAKEAMTMELRDWNDWQAGRMVGYVVEDGEGEEIDSCWGYLPEGNNYAWAIQCAKEAVDHHIGDPSNHAQPGEH